MNNKKNTILTTLAIVALLIMLVGATYAFFEAQSDDAVTRNVNVLTHTVDTLSFSISNAISIEADQFNFGSNGNNLSSEATATAVLSPNSKTGSATEHYNMYLNITNNEIVSTDHYEAPSNAYLTSLCSGYDCQLFDDYAIEELYQILRESNPLGDEINNNTYSQEVKAAVNELITERIYTELFRYYFAGCEYATDQYNACIWDFNNNTFYNTTSPINIEIEPEMGNDITVISGGVTDAFINVLKAAGWFNLNNPDLMLQVFDENNDLVELEDLGGLRTVKGVTGYDITGVTGIIPLLVNEEIEATNNTEEEQTYQVVVTLINKDVNQNANAGKDVEASLIVRKDDIRSEGLWVNYTKISDYSPEVIMDNLKYELDDECLNDIVYDMDIIPSDEVPEWSFDATAENAAIVTVSFNSNISIVTEFAIETNPETGDSVIYTNNTINTKPEWWESWNPSELSTTGYLEYNNYELINPTQMYNGIAINPNLVDQFENVLLSLDTECAKKLIGEPQITINP